MRKMVNIDTATVEALERLAADRKLSFQDLVEEAVADLLKKHRRPVTTKEMFSASLNESHRRKRG
jgi:Ribbon-helix-helix protein, copG family